MYLKLEKEIDEKNGAALAISFIELRTPPINPPKGSARYKQIGRHADKIFQLGGSKGFNYKATFLKFIPYVNDEDVDLTGHAYQRALLLPKKDDDYRDELVPDITCKLLFYSDKEENQSSDTALIQRNCAESFIGTFQYTTFRFPTDSLETQTRVEICHLLCDARAGRNKENLVLCNIFAMRWALCDKIIDSNREKLPPELIKHLQDDVIDMLPTDMLPKLGKIMTLLAEKSGNYDKHLNHLDKAKVNLQWWPAATAYGSALIAMPDMGLEDFIPYVNQLMLDAREKYNAYFAMLLRHIHSDIRAKQPTPKFAEEQNKILTEFRAATDEKEYDLVFDLIDLDIKAESEKLALQAKIARANMEELLASYKAPHTNKKQTSRPKKGENKSKKSTPIKTGKQEVFDKIKPVLSNEPAQSGLEDFLKFMRLDCQDLQKQITSLLEDEKDSALSEAKSSLLILIDETLKNLESALQSKKFTEKDADTVVKACQKAQTTLRNVIKENQTTEAFDKALKKAVTDETITLNRRAGGEITSQHGNPPWHDIWARYHDKPIDSAYEIIIGTKTRYLCENECIAYYVTTSSRSGYDFDISAHYWVRLEGRTSDPIDEDGFMNRADWYDTYIPCFVLHVPKV
ncbi:hypothetical protein [Govanella unica]|uniref:Uncharacterized protein n=1 Tax=Govanella unica TaxID=2975056 RepID=A0A9X3TZK2_9PROT|nr:hypothetical protein [Govania unica]MDA5194885.1 hypothetical protein [Govania unica]